MRQSHADKTLDLPCSFSKNTCGGGAGGIQTYSGDIVQVSACNFTNNTGFNGGGIYTVRTFAPELPDQC